MQSREVQSKLLRTVNGPLTQSDPFAILSGMGFTEFDISLDLSFGRNRIA